MSGGLVALLDDIATLAKATASSIDDVASSAVKVSAKAVGVVIDDTAVTPQYVSGLSPKRELPIIGKIAKASLINKLVVILPVALLLTWFAPQVLPFLLIAGGAYLCFEGGERVLEALHWLPEHEDSAEDYGPSKRGRPRKKHRLFGLAHGPHSFRGNHVGLHGRTERRVHVDARRGSDRSRFLHDFLCLRNRCCPGANGRFWASLSQGRDASGR